VTLAYLVDGDRFKLAMDEGAIVKGDAFKAMADVRALINECQALSDQLREERRQGFENERRRGFAVGSREGLVQCAEQLVQVEAEAARYIEALDDKLVRLAIEVVRRVAPRIGSNQMVPELVEQALKEVRAERFLVVRVHPDNHASVTRRVEELKHSYPMIEFIDVLSDPQLDAFACVLESEAGMVRADLSVQLDAIERAMRQSVAARDKTGAP
jgi:type III secretion protein L